MVGRTHAKRATGGRAALDAAAMPALLRHAWPGNLRELDNVLRRAYAIALMGQSGAASRDLVIEEEHVRHALAYDGAEPGGSLIDALVAAAAAFVAEVERRGPGALDLDLTDGFKGFVLGVATEKLGGNVDAAFKLLGREKLVAGRNHQKVMKREIERAQALCVALGEKDPFPFTRALDGEPGPSSSKG